MRYEKLTVTSPPQSPTEPLTVAVVKTILRIPTADTTKDSMIELYIVAARQLAETRQGRDLVGKQWDLTMDCFPRVIETRDNLSTVDLLRYRDSDGNYTTLVQNTDYIVDTVQGLVMPPYGESWPSFTAWPSSAVLCRYTVAPPTIDEEIKLGMKFAISLWYNNGIPAELGASAVQQYPYCLGLLDHGKREFL